MDNKQKLIDQISLIKVNDPETQINLFKRGLLRKIDNYPPEYIWIIEKFRWYEVPDLKEIIKEVTKIDPVK